MHNIEEGLLGNDPLSRRVCSGPGAGTTREADKRIIAATFIDTSEAKVTAPESAPIRTTDRRTDPVPVWPHFITAAAAKLQIARAPNCIRRCMHEKVCNEREGNWETCIGTVNGILFSEASVPIPPLPFYLRRRCWISWDRREGRERGEGEIEAEKKWVSVHSVD